VIADFGCGDARLGQSVPHKVYSFDLQACNDYVTECDMAHVPLPDGSVDIAIFSLSLMGTNFVDYLLEARLVLKPGGLLKIAEVKSRFLDLSKFKQLLVQLGFSLVSEDDSNKMFILFEFSKTATLPLNMPSDIRTVYLKPCLYKKR